MKYRYYFLPIIMNLLATKKTFALALIALTIVLLCPLSLYADPVAEITGAPSGLTNQTNPVISITGNDVVAYRYKLDGGDYSGEISVNTPISFSADVTIFGLPFIAGPIDLQNFLDDRTDYIDSVTFENVAVDTPVVFLLNKMRMTLKTDNILYIEGSKIDQLDVHMNNSPSVPAAVINQSLSEGSGYITYDLTTDTPETDFIRIINRGTGTASFKINLNNILFATDADVLTEIQAMPPEYLNEPIERKVWRFIPDNSYKWNPLTYFSSTYWSWVTASPALFFNSIGFGLCYNYAELYCQLMTSFGYQARMWLFPAHTVPEVYINGKWVLYDPYLKVYYYNYIGELAGVEELAAHPDLITSPINPLLDPANSAYSQYIADIYSSGGIIFPWVYEWYHDNPNYLLTLQIPAGGILEFPAVFAAPIHTFFYTEAPSYTNARLTIPPSWAGTLNTPLVIHSIGYDGLHTLSVVAKNSIGDWQTTPTVANWTTDSWAPITMPQQSDVTDPVILSANEPATIYYSLDGSTPTTDSPVYSEPVNMSLSPVLKFFAIDAAGNREKVKCYSPVTGEVYEDYLTPPPPVTGVTLTMDKPSPQAQGTVITFTAAASGGSGSYEYLFRILDLNTGRWTTRRYYSINPSWIWYTTESDAGSYTIQVLARNAGSTAAYDAYKTVSFMIYLPNFPPPVTGVTLTMDKNSPQVQGEVTTFMAAALGGIGVYEYQFMLRNPITGQWSIGQVYSSDPVWTWDTTGIDTGTYMIQVLARNAGSPVEYDAYKSASFMIYPPNFPPIVRAYGTEPAYYFFIQDAYAACSNGYVIEIFASDVYENLNLNLPLSVTLRGGFDTNWTGNVSYTTINGTLTISDGTVEIENIVIQ